MLAVAMMALLQGAPGQAPAATRVTLEPAFGALTFDKPLAVHSLPGAPQTYVVAEQDGVLWRVAKQDGTWRRKRWLDLRGKVRRRHIEEGLLSFAFHPSFPKTPQIFVYYSASKPRRTVLARFRVGGVVLRDSEKVLLQVPQPYGNHNGGTVLFGPDGYLYLSLGDGGSAGDPKGNAQNLSSLLGSILRLDVSPKGAYAIPKDNPFVGRPGARAEIWAYGLRNVWRMSFDPETGKLWAADVGQDEWEEIDIIRRGGNYGWNIMEGSHPYVHETAKGPLMAPVYEYDHSQGVSITGGYVYRGKKIPSLVGAYIFGDFGSGQLWALRTNGSVANVRIGAGRLIASFGVDAAGELLVTSFDGRVYRVVP